MHARWLGTMVAASLACACSALVDFTPPPDEEDAGELEPDAGPERDAGPSMDAGEDGGPDAGPAVDGGPPDAGPIDDAGPPLTECGTNCMCRSIESCNFACTGGGCTVDCRVAAGGQPCCVVCGGTPCCAADRMTRVSLFCSGAEACTPP